MENLDYLLFMQSLVQESNLVAIQYFNSNIKAEYKEDTSPVTMADKRIEELLRERISQNFPDHAIIGEEYENTQTSSEYCWVIDPIDGTKNFAAGIPCFATLIALCHNNKPILGCISAPAMNKIWIGGIGDVARCNGIPIKTRQCDNIDDAWFSYTAPSIFTSQQLEKIKYIESLTKVNIYGNDAISYALVAEGRMDLVIEDKLKPWDFAALVPVIKAAGGYVSDFEGKEIDLSSDGSIIVAASKNLHQSALDMIKG